jgi:holo-[acyl-carrier protein] synthase
VILGIGTDICDIRRIEQSIDRFGARFLNKTFTLHEQAYCESKARPGLSYAKRFAAKEAVAKAIAGPETGSLSWLSVEIDNDPSGRPIITLYNDALKRADDLSPENHATAIHLSLSDDYPYATAFAIAQAVPDVRQGA